jgi:diguanylate cyclase
MTSAAAEPATDDGTALIGELRMLLASFGERVASAPRASPGAGDGGVAARLAALERALRSGGLGPRTVRRLRGTLAAQRELLAQLGRRLDEVERIASLDGLTGALNRAAGERRLAEEVAAALAQARPLSLLISDIDEFKAFNDRFGHQMGDHVLRLVAHCLGAFPGPGRIVFRQGGDELVLVAPGLALEHGVAVARLIATAIAGRRLRIRGTDQELDPVTISGGVAELRRDEDAAALIRRADTALYAAKRSGRNRILTA